MLAFYPTAYMKSPLRSLRDMVALTQRMPKMIIMQELSTNIGRAQTE